MVRLFNPLEFSADDRDFDQDRSDERDRMEDLQRDFDQERRDLEREDALQRREDERRMSKEAEQRLLDALVPLTVQDIRDLVNDGNMKVTPLSMCLRQANAELRTKSGKLRKGKTQADIMRRAQKLLRKC